MASADDPLERAYRPPAEPAEPSATPLGSPSPDLRLVRLHLLVLALAMLSFVVVTAGMQLELWNPGPRLTAEAYNRSFTIHGTAFFTILMPVAFGVLPMLVLPSAFGMRFPTLVAWPALAAWGLGVVPWWAWLEPSADATLRLASFLAAPGAACLYAMGLVLAVLGGGRAAFGRAPVLAIGLVLGGVGGGLLVAIGVVLPLLGPASVVAPGPFDSLFPVLVATAVGIVERRRDTAVLSPRREGIYALALLLTWGVYAARLDDPTAHLLPVTVLVLPLALYVIVRIARFALAAAFAPAGMAVLLALVSMGIAAVTDKFLATLSRDVHLHDTYFVLAPMHLAGAAALLLLVAGCLHRSPALFGREPRRIVGLVGVLGFGGGLLTSFIVMAVLGQRGMPRQYMTYVPQFESLHQWIGLGGLIAAVGLVVVVVAIATGRRRADD